MCTAQNEKAYLCIPFVKQAVRLGLFIPHTKHLYLLLLRTLEANLIDIDSEQDSKRHWAEGSGNYIHNDPFITQCHGNNWIWEGSVSTDYLQQL